MQHMALFYDNPKSDITFKILLNYFRTKFPDDHKNLL